MSGKRSSKTEDELRGAALDVAFEFRMFRQAMGRLDAGSPSVGHNNSTAGCMTPTSGGVTITAMNCTPTEEGTAGPNDFHNVEGILVHFRNLVEFFFTTSRSKDDLVLAHHFTGRDPQGPPTWARDYGRRCNELLSHLTYSRADYRQNDHHHWPDILEKGQLMEREINEFLSSLSPERRTWFGC